MSGNNYDSPLETTHTFDAAVLSAAATVGRIAGPAGKVGRVKSINGVVTTGITVLDGTVSVRSAGEAAAVTGTLPIASVNDPVSATAAEIEAGTELLADTTVEVVAGGEPTAGAADLTVVIGWY